MDYVRITLPDGTTASIPDSMYDEAIELLLQARGENAAPPPEDQLTRDMVHEIMAKHYDGTKLDNRVGRLWNRLTITSEFIPYCTQCKNTRYDKGSQLGRHCYHGKIWNGRETVVPISAVKAQRYILLTQPQLQVGPALRSDFQSLLDELDQL